MIKRSFFLNSTIGIITIMLLSLAACSRPVPSDRSQLCGGLPFEGGVEVSSPLVPISVLIGADGVNFKIEGGFQIDLFVFELQPYATFSSSGMTSSPCLKVEIYNLELEGQYKRFIVNFNNDNEFRVLVDTNGITEFVFNQERWVAHPPGEQEFVRYEYTTNTLFLDASNDHIKEFTIIAEIPRPGKTANFCLNELQRGNSETFPNIFTYFLAFFQDTISSTREGLLHKFGHFGGGVTILFTWLIVIVGLLKQIAKQREKTSSKLLLSYLIFFFLWTGFWFAVYKGASTCWD